MLTDYAQSNKILNEKVYPPPVQGKYYTVGKGINLYEISIKSYGYDKTELLTRSNTILQSRPLDSITLLPLVYQDDRIYIPLEKK